MLTPSALFEMDVKVVGVVLGASGVELHSAAAVAQLVVAPDCGSGCRGFESHQPPHARNVLNPQD